MATVPLCYYSFALRPWIAFLSGIHSKVLYDLGKHNESEYLDISCEAIKLPVNIHNRPA